MTPRARTLLALAPALLACRPPVPPPAPVVQPSEPCARRGVSPDSPACMRALTEEGYVYLESAPPGVELWVDGALVGTGPAWRRFAPGRHVLDCKSKADTFLAVPFEAGRDPSVLCQRENRAGTAEVENFTGEEKAGGVLVFLGGLAATAALILLPFLIF